MTLRRLALATLLLAPAAFAPAFAQNADFRLNNGLDQPIREVYVSSSGESAWGSDLLGSNLLAPGGVLTLSVPAGQCENDIRLVLANGATLERRGLNTCTLTDVTVTP